MKITKVNIETINKRIAYYQKLRKMSSADMQLRLQSGKLKETHDICCWLMLLELKRRIEK